MDLQEEILPGVLRLRLRAHKDVRGIFVKTYAASAFTALGISFESREEFYSVSGKNVLRGMHFQLPPHDHMKMVYCLTGSVRDVLLDLRAGPGYGRSVEVALSAEDPALLVIPPGIAHGFLSLEDGTLMGYKTSTEYCPEADAGIHWDSFGHDWQLSCAPVTSERDARHPGLPAFVSPF
jgi:dTDP-4-dehydrorhamnose 3,5-epimerase/CDP-3, 6-dideoxy-D-glycero-D-glycero-4-hexulose-5-epimerase